MELKLEDFVQMEEIDKQYFPKENIAPAEESFRWYLADPNSCVVVKDRKMVVAYINILSLKKDVYDKVKYNKKNESQIVMEDLELSSEKYYNYIYFPVIVVDKKHRNLKTLISLLEETKKQIKNVLEKGFKIIEAMVDCSTKEGTKISQRILKLKPFMPTSHNSVIHILDGESFMKNLNLKNGEK